MDGTENTMVVEASDLRLDGFPDVLVVDAVEMPRVRHLRDGDGDVVAAIYRRPDGGEFHVLND